MEAYKRWIQRNRDYVHSLESLANWFNMASARAVFRIGNWTGSRFCRILITSFLGIITTVNEHILESTRIQTRTGHGEFSSFPFALWITLLKDMETLVEAVAQQFYGEEKKWKFMALTESIKVLLRLAILRKSGYKMLLHGGESINDRSGSNDFDSHRNGLFSGPGPRGVPGGLNNHGQTSMNLEGRAVSALSKFGENARAVSQPTWLREVQHQQEIMEPPTPVTKTPSLSTFLSEKGIPGGLFLTGELTVGHVIISSITTLCHNSKDFHHSNIEKNELKRRKLMWALYLMRDPFFTKYTRLDSTEKLLQHVPVIGLLTEKLVELLVGAQTRYTYMSGS
ncbi:hypothetical protein OROGR_030011 [Orobanche gracilis]